MGGDDRVLRPSSGGLDCAATGASLLDVGAICSQAVCSIAQSAMIGSIANQPIDLVVYAARR